MSLKGTICDKFCDTTALKQAGCKRIYEEKVSGATRDRPALTRMLDQLRDGDVVVVARLDRLARSTRDLLEIAEILKEGGTGLRSLGEPWADTTSPAGKMVLTVFAGMASSSGPSSTSEQARGGLPPGRGACASGAEGALPPRPTERGLQGGRAARLRRSQRDPLARSPAAPARIPPPAPPVSPTGRGHGEALTPARNEGKPNMTKQTNRKPGATAAASAPGPDAYTRITNRIVADLEQGVRP